ncbi:hypothetical protein HDZ31DRAFT_45261 [Schizophyllum fasciatum]
MASEAEVMRQRLDLAKKKQATAATSGRKTRSRTTKADAPGKENRASEAPTRAGSVTVPWRQHIAVPYTYELLNVVAEKTKYKIAFGMDKGAASLDPSAAVDPNENNPTCQTQLDHARSIARKLFLPVVFEDGTTAYRVEGELNGRYAEDDLADLATCVKNRIYYLKKKYMDERKKLGETGMGLVAENKEDTMTSGSHMKNVWDNIKKKFPYFKILHNLMGSSPIVDRGALANSTSGVDTSVLGRGAQSFEPCEETPVDTDARPAITPADIAENGTRPTSRKRSRNDLVMEDDMDDASIIDVDTSGADDDSEGSDSDSDDQPTPKVRKTAARFGSRTPAKSTSTVVAPVSASKRRQPMDIIADAAAEDRKSRHELMKYKERKKNERAKEKSRAQLKVELAKLKQQQLEAELRRESAQHAREEAERQREFQREMMQQQLELERIRAGSGTPGAPHFGFNSAGPPPPGPPYNFV